jgi:putative oxidoreductase
MCRLAAALTARATGYGMLCERSRYRASMTDTVRIALTMLRAGTAAVLIAHGVARVRLGIVDDFGAAFAQWGFPAGTVLAWVITIVEIVGGTTLAAGYVIRPLTLWFAIQLMAGIYLVHGSAGWFVVGAGRNGMEFSMLLLLCLLVIAMCAPAGHVLGRSR